MIEVKKTTRVVHDIRIEVEKIEDAEDEFSVSLSYNTAV